MEQRIELEICKTAQSVILLYLGLLLHPAMNQVEAFRYVIRKGQVYRLDERIPGMIPFRGWPGESTGKRGSRWSLAFRST